MPRARLGDGAWATALARDWAGLNPPLRLQALEAAVLLPEALRAELKARLKPSTERSSGQLQKLWEALGP
jgi:hypothetical protein